MISNVHDKSGVYRLNCNGRTEPHIGQAGRSNALRNTTTAWSLGIDTPVTDVDEPLRAQVLENVQNIIAINEKSLFPYIDQPCCKETCS